MSWSAGQDPLAVPPAVAQAGTQITSAAQAATASGAQAVNSSLTGMGVPQGAADAVSGALSQEAQKGFTAAFKAIGKLPGKLGGLFHHHKHVAAIPQIQVARAAVPPAQVAGFDHAIAIVNATMVNAAATPSATPASTSAAATAAVTATPPPPAALASVDGGPPSIVPAVIGGLVLGAGALFVGAEIAVAGAVAAVGGLAVHIFRKVTR
jgi:hypothetical protein